MKADMFKFFTLQRQIFGVCPCCNSLFRLSDSKVFLRKKPMIDWFDKAGIRAFKLSEAEERLDEREDALRRSARKRGRRLAMRIVRKVDTVFTPRRLNPDDAKVIFHPVDYVVFNGMKSRATITNIILLDRISDHTTHRQLQRSIERCVEREAYEWQTLRVKDDGTVTADK